MFWYTNRRLLLGRFALQGSGDNEESRGLMLLELCRRHSNKKNAIIPGIRHSGQVGIKKVSMHLWAVTVVLHCNDSDTDELSTNRADWQVIKHSYFLSLLRCPLWK